MLSLCSWSQSPGWAAAVRAPQLPPLPVRREVDDDQISLAASVFEKDLLRSGLALGAGISLGPLVGCATPTGAPGPRTASLALNRSVVSLDNKLNQFDAALTVQRAVRQSLITLDQHLKPRLVLADRFELTSPTQWYVHLRPGIIYSDGRPVQVQDVATALKMYSEVSGSFVGGFFPEWPTVDQIDESSFTLNTVRPVPVSIT